MTRNRILLTAVIVAVALICSVPAAFAGDYGKPAQAYKIKAFITGYSWYDNTPRGSADICCGVIHENASGTGTYKDPITVAVPGSQGDMETPPGTRLYFPHAMRYGIVEDSGATEMSRKHFDWWVDGRNYSESNSEDCMSEITGLYTIVVNPRQGLPVTVGSLTGPDGCRITRPSAAAG